MHASGASGNCGHHKLLPKTCEPADLRACRNHHNECPKPTHELASGGQVFAAGKTLGLDHRDQIERLSAKICTKLGMSAALTLTVCTRFSCGLLASVDQLTLLACNAKKAPMSISVPLSQKQRRLGLCLLPPLVYLDFGCSCGLCRFLTPVSFPCCCCHVLCCYFDHDLCLCWCGSFG